MRPREDRQKVMIRARMRSGASWHDVCILNVSLHGVGIQSAAPPARGTYVEICRGAQTVIARVVWSKGHRAGLRSQDAVFIRSLVCDHAAKPQPQIARGVGVERRQKPRRPQQQTHDHSRLIGRAMEFACMALFAGALAMTAFGTVEQALAKPLSQLSEALG